MVVRSTSGLDIVKSNGGSRWSNHPPDSNPNAHPIPTTKTPTQPLTLTSTLVMGCVTSDTVLYARGPLTRIALSDKFAACLLPVKCMREYTHHTTS